MSQVTGIDIAGVNGPWNFGPFEGHDGFVFIRATSWGTKGPTIDDEFLRSWRISGDKGFVRGAYHELRTDAGLSGTTQAERLVRYVHDAGIEPGDMLVCAQDSPYTAGRDPRMFSQMSLAFCHTLNRELPHHRVLIYTDVSGAEAGYCHDLHVYPLWIAEYQVSEPRVPAEWADHGLTWSFWQSSGEVPPDRDVFNGDRAALHRFTHHLEP